jgi:structural maintenance of chromosome 2
MHQLEVGRDSKYFIDSKIATRSKVTGLFCSVKLNVNNPHFLIMQGRVTKVINMKPTELLGLVEEAAGTSLYQVKREQAQNHLKKKELKVQEIENIIKEEVTPKLEQLKRDKNNFDSYKSKVGELESSEKILVAF